MSFADASVQEQTIEFFRRAVRSKRLAHAYILVGPEGVGKRALARAIARYLFCASPGDDACGKCRSCRLIDSNQFPDLHWYVRPEDKTQLTVEVIEEFQRAVHFKASESEHKVFVLEEADRLNPASANKLLKILEEPPPESLILLLALDVRDFLPTILSRCHVVRLRPLSVKAVVTRLERERLCTPEQARYLGHFTMGSPGLAMTLASGNFFPERAWLLDALVAMREGAHFATAEEMHKRSGDKDEAARDRRETLLRFFDVAALFYRDVLACRLQGGQAPLINTDRAADVKALAGRLSVDGIRRILAVIDRAREAVAFNANQKLLIENLTFDIAKLQTP